MTQSSPGHPEQFTENSHKLPSAFPTPVLSALQPSRGPPGLKGRKNRELGMGEMQQGEEDIPHSAMGKQEIAQSNLVTAPQFRSTSHIQLSILPLKLF